MILHGAILSKSLLFYFIRINLVYKNFNSAFDIPKDTYILQQTFEKMKHDIFIFLCLIIYRNTNIIEFYIWYKYKYNYLYTIEKSFEM